MQFLYSPLTWGFLLVGVPILVHLINLLRHRRRKWAAMEFLMDSYRRNRRWIMLKQLLLLLARMVAMALLVIMLAKWVSSAQWLSWLGGRTTHHYVLLDDSYSMNAVGSDGRTAYARAQGALAGLLTQIAGQPGEHQITLARWSRAALALKSQAPSTTPKEKPQSDNSAQPANSVQLASMMGLAADLLAQSVPPDPGKLLDRVAASQPTGLQLTPEAAVELLKPALTAGSGELPVVYLFSDLRRNQFSEAQSLKGHLDQLSKQDVPIHVVDCSAGEGQNLGVVSLAAEQEVWAAGVPLMVRFAVRNFSGAAARNVVAKLRMINYGDGQVAPAVDKEYSGTTVDLPPVVIESIEPGQSVTRQFQVVFPSAGSHVVEVSIADDVLDADNRRWSTVTVKQSQRVLLVDGDVQQTNAFFFESVIQPGERLQTGMSFDRRDASYLRDCSDDDLNAYEVVALLDVPRLDPQAVSKLETFASAGGGLLIVCGGNTSPSFVNEQLYRQGKGMMPVELAGQEQQDEQIQPSGPQVSASDHPLLAPLQRLSASPFFALRIRKFWQASPASLQQSGLQPVASGPRGSPIIVDKAFGQGRTVCMLTGLGSDWSNWAADPTFVVLALRGLGYLSSFRREPNELPIGHDIKMVVAGKSVTQQGDILLPQPSGKRIRLQRPVDNADSLQPAKLLLTTDLQASGDRGLLDSLLKQGLYESWMQATDGQYLVRTEARNTSPEEGNLERISHQELQRQMQGIEMQVRSSDALASGLSTRESSQSNLLMLLLIGLLLGEQALAYSSSYHAGQTKRRIASSSGISTSPTSESQRATMDATKSAKKSSNFTPNRSSSSRIQSAAAPARSGR